MEKELKKAAYLMLIFGHKKRSSHSSFESITHPDILETMSTMLGDLLVAQDIYLCETTSDQVQVESTIRTIYEELLQCGQVTNTPLNVDTHLRFLERSLSEPLPEFFYMLDSSQAWIVYWLLNAHVVLSGNPISAELRERASKKINSLILEDGLGGIAGGSKGQIGHVALTYAALLVLTLIEDYETLHRIRDNLGQWFALLKHSDGSFAMHANGERDTRSTYCVLVAVSLLRINVQGLLSGTLNWILSCQTFEGGFSGVPDAEAHGGYTFCAVASLFLLPGGAELLDLPNLLRWLSGRQFQLEGGFSGRTNKLVDSCYSFWIGAVFALVECITKEKTLFNRQALRCYIHNCCQDERGGLKDKPGKHPDFYHTNYSICGLSIAEHCYTAQKLDGFSFKSEEVDDACYTLPVNPVFGLPLGYAERCRMNMDQLVSH